MKHRKFSKEGRVGITEQLFFQSFYHGKLSRQKRPIPFPGFFRLYNWTWVISLHLTNSKNHLYGYRVQLFLLNSSRLIYKFFFSYKRDREVICLPNSPSRSGQNIEISLQIFRVGNKKITYCITSEGNLAFTVHVLQWIFTSTAIVISRPAVFLCFCFSFLLTWEIASLSLAI